MKTNTAHQVDRKTIWHCWLRICRERNLSTWCSGAHLRLQLLRRLREDDSKFKSRFTLSPKIDTTQWKQISFKSIKGIYKTHSWQRHIAQWERWSVCPYQEQARISTFTSIVVKDTTNVISSKLEKKKYWFIHKQGYLWRKS